MLEPKYDPTLPYHFARYGRMSDPRRQNKRSPDQQFTTIDETLARCGYPWVCVGTYRDDGISGRYLRKRRDLQRLLRDIEAGLIQIDLIAVDTLERLGRAEEIAELRRKLFVEYGVLIVAADNSFCDPTGVVGKAVGVIEQVRSTENTRISRHNIIRGKKDAARLGRWPGGPPPFGFGLKSAIDDSCSPPKVYQVLDPIPRELAAMQLAFQRAATTGHGALRVSRWWTSNPAIPDDFKPISEFTMAYRLQNPIYIGTLRWGDKRTGVINDTRVVEAAPDNEVLYVPNFCTPSVDKELYDRIQRLSAARGQKIKESRKKSGENRPQKLIAPQARGLTLKYLLTGLARCGRCGASMRPVCSGRKSKAGRRYTYYVCPRQYHDACSNARHVPEDQLRAAVVSRLRARLFPPPEQAGEVPPWLPRLMEEVRQEVHRFRLGEPNRTAAAAQELHDLERQLAGWTLTLGDPQLPASVRGDIVASYEHAKLRKGQLLQELNSTKALEKHVEQTLDAKTVVAQLQRLADVLAGANPTLGNLELTKHIDRIDCHPDGRVDLRGTYLGLFEGAVELLSRDGAKKSDADATVKAHERLTHLRS